ASRAAWVPLPAPCLPSSTRRGPCVLMRSGQEPFVVPHHELAVDLLHRFQRDTDRDEQRGSAKWELLDVPQCEDEKRYDGDRCEEQRARQCDAVEHFREIALGL